MKKKSLSVKKIIPNHFNFKKILKDKKIFKTYQEFTKSFENLEKGLKKIGFNDKESNDILGNNWFNFYKNI